MLSDCLLHDPRDETGCGKPVVQGLDKPDPEAVALIDLQRPSLATPGAFPDPVVGAQSLDIVASLGFHIVTLDIDQALADLLATDHFVGTLGGVGHCRSVKDWQVGEKRKR